MSLKQNIYILCAAALFGPATPAQAENFRRIETETEFRNLLVGRKLILGENTVVFKSNGRLVGEFGGEKLQGVWQWRNGYWCRTLSTHSKNTDCQLFEISGNKVRGTRSRGKGKSFVYTLK